MKVYILLQEYKGWFGRIYSWLKGGTYNHASIGIDDTFSEFYSFRTKWGLCVEHPFDFAKRHKEDVPCAIYEIEISEDQYEKLTAGINGFLDEKDDYHYSYLSLVLGFIGVKHNIQKGLYCSRFVANLLKQSEILSLDKHPSLYMPSDLLKVVSTVRFEGPAREFNLMPA